MADRSPTRRIPKNERDLHLMRLRDEITKLSTQLKRLGEQPADAQRDAERASLEARLQAVRQDLMISMAATDKLA
jgi:hypothetical protein